MKPIRTAVVGYGLAGQFIHSPFLATQSAHYDVAYIVERHKSDSKKLFPNAEIVRDFYSLLEKKDLELIIVTTPNDTHFEYGEASLKAGKHVVIDKPFTITSRDALTLIELQRETKKILSVFQNRRYDNDFLTIREILSKKTLGDIELYEAHFDRFAPQLKPGAWRERDEPGAGTLYDLGPHLVDQALFLFGVPQTISADVRIEREHAVAPDYFDVQLQYPNHKVVLKSSFMVEKPGPRYQVIGKKGAYIKYFIDPQEGFLRAGELPNQKNWGAEPAEHYGILETEHGQKPYPSVPGNYGLYYEKIFRAIRNGEELSEKPEHGYNTIKLIELATESNRQKKSMRCEELLNCYSQSK